MYSRRHEEYESGVFALHVILFEWFFRLMFFVHRSNTSLQMSVNRMLG